MISGRPRDAELSRVIDVDLHRVVLPETGLAISGWLASRRPHRTPVQQGRPHGRPLLWCRWSPHSKRRAARGESSRPSALTVFQIEVVERRIASGRISNLSCPQTTERNSIGTVVKLAHTQRASSLLKVRQVRAARRIARNVLATHSALRNPPLNRQHAMVA